MFFNRIGDNILKPVSVKKKHLYEYLTIETTTVQLKPKWDRCNKYICKRSIKPKKILQQFEVFLRSLTDKIDILQPLAHLNAVLKQATCESIQNHKTSLKIKGQRICWIQKMQEVILKVVAYGGSGAKQGNQYDLKGPTRQRMVEARVVLRKLQRLEAAIPRKAQVEDNMTSDNFSKKVSEYDQKIPQSHTADQPTAPRGRATEHL